MSRSDGKSGACLVFSQQRQSSLHRAVSRLLGGWVASDSRATYPSRTGVEMESTDDEDMFNVESAVRQLKPDYIVQHVLEAEERHWVKVHLGPDQGDSASTATSSSSAHTSSGGYEQQDPGQVLIRHGTSVRKIHSYFSQLEFRKCCLHLAGRKSTLQSMRVVLTSNATVDDGSAKKTATLLTFVTHLEDKELRAFKHAYLCAAYPVLAAPDPPSPFTPSPPVNPRSHPGSPHRGDSRRSPGGTATPYSLHDSGLEESEDLAFIPSESICAHLQRAFHLTDDKFRDYRYLINKTYVRKSAQKLLAEELAGQLAVLENNCHPFYTYQDFLPPNGYAVWRKAEHSALTELLGKFWPYALPFPRNSRDLMAELNIVHDDYRILLGKLLSYERDFHRQAEEEGGMLVSPLSTASVRLLKEFGLRYGVGEQFRRILYLDQISSDFSPSLWYARHVLSVLNTVTDLLPAHRPALAMVKKEYDMLMSCLLRLTTQVSKALEQMKSLFPGNKPTGAVELLMVVLQRIRELRMYLLTPAQKEPAPFLTTLNNIVHGMFFQTYEKCKTVIRTELKNNRDVHVCPRMLNALIMEMRNELLDYRNHFDLVFKPYFDITVMAAKTFYSLLMKDVENLCQQVKLRENAIDLRMLALVHRLDQLDNDWTVYIKPQEQTWRKLFQGHLDRWGSALLLHAQDLVLETIAGDAFVTQQVQLSSDSSPPRTIASSSPHTFRSMSLTPSLNSAFSSFPPTPKQGSSLSIPQWAGPVGRESEETATDTPTPIQPPAQQPSPGPWEGAGVGGDFLSFADKRRHCASLPVFSPRTAMVRVVSDARMLDRPHARPHGPGLKTAAALQDLSGAGEGGGATAGGFTPLGPRPEDSMLQAEDWDDGEAEGVCEGAGGVPSAPQPLEAQPPRWQTEVLSDGEDSEPTALTLAPYSDSELDASEDSPDEAFSFPPVQDVTDSNVSGRESPSPPPMVHSGRKSARGRADQFVRSISSDDADSQEQPLWKNTEEVQRRELERVRQLDLAGQGRGGRQSCPQPLAPPHRRPGEGEEEDQEPHAFRPLPRRTHPAQVSAFRKISTASTLPDSEPTLKVGAGSGVTESEHQFLQSVQSSVSFPALTPGGLEAVIPVSGSVVDLLVLLQRVLGFSRSLCAALFPPRYRGPALGPGVLPPDVAALMASLRAGRTDAHFNVVKVLSQAIGVYADNMMCLDLCAMPKDVAKRVIGSSLVEHAMRQRLGGRVWGCRHQLEGHTTCYAFHNRKATYLSERYEPITQKMCVRINNMVACQKFLDWCQTQTQPPGESASSGPPSASSHLAGPGTSLGAAFAASQPYCSPDASGSSATDDAQRPHDLTLQLIEQMKTHLMAVWTALCRLLAFRINLFLKDGLTLLLSLKPLDVSVATCLLPLTTFLRSHLDALSSWLYSHSFRRVIEFLWIYIVQDIELEASKLGMGKESRVSPHILLQTVTHLMKFMNNCEKGITRDLLLSQADTVVTKLQLFTLSTLHVIALYQRLAELSSEGEVGGGEGGVAVPERALHQMQRDLQRRRKCFSGAQLVAWVRRNSDLFLTSDELSLCGGNANFSTESSEAIGQQLLEMELIVDVEDANTFDSRSSSRASVQEYPEVSLLDPLPASGRQDAGTLYPRSDNTPTPTPTPTPHHGHSAETSAQIHGTPQSWGEDSSAQDSQHSGHSSPDQHCSDVMLAASTEAGTRHLSADSSSQTDKTAVNVAGGMSAVDSARRTQATMRGEGQSPGDGDRAETSSAQTHSHGSEVQGGESVGSWAKGDQEQSREGAGDGVTPRLPQDWPGEQSDAQQRGSPVTPTSALGGLGADPDGQSGTHPVATQVGVAGQLGLSAAPDAQVKLQAADLEDSGVAVGRENNASVVNSAETSQPTGPNTPASSSSYFLSTSAPTSASPPTLLSPANLASDAESIKSAWTVQSQVSSDSTKGGSKPTFASALSSQMPSSDSSHALPSYLSQPYPAVRDTPGMRSLYDLDMNSICPTPASFVSLTPFQGMGPVFENSSHKFYFLPSNPLSVPSSQHPHPPHHHGSRLPGHPSAPVSALDRALLQLKNSEETGSLADKCLTLKVSPTWLLMVLYGRRKTDELAQSFLGQLPAGLLQQLSARATTRTGECSVL